MSYGNYLHLDAILGAQAPRSPDHNEMLFIVQHQTNELWMKLMLHELSAAITCIAKATNTHWNLYQLSEELTDLEDAFRLWRFRHVTTVERVIGFKRGTGGTGGVSYLRKMLDVVLFPEIWTLRTEL